MILGCSTSVIPNYVTGIGDSAFYGYSELSNITLPSSVTSIGNNAFVACYSLTGITIPSGVIIIGDNAFAYCYGLTNISFEPNSSLTSIGYYAFADCHGLTDITIPSGVTYIGGFTFEYWTSDQTIYIEADVSVLGEWDADWASNCDAQIVWGDSSSYYTPGLAFSFIYDDYGNPAYEVSVGTSLEDGNTDVIIPAMYDELPVVKVADYAFYYCTDLTKVIFRSSSLTVVGNYAFGDCHSLTNINIPGSVSFIGNYAFAYCYSLTALAIPLSVTYIEYNTFEGCDSLAVYAETEAYPSDWQFLSSSSNYSVIWECVLSADKTYVIFFIN